MIMQAMKLTGDGLKKIEETSVDIFTVQLIVSTFSRLVIWNCVVTYFESVTEETETFFKNIEGDVLYILGFKSFQIQNNVDYGAMCVINVLYIVL